MLNLKKLKRLLLRLLVLYKWVSQWKFISLKEECMKMDEYIKSTILACLENNYTTDIEYLQEVRNALKQKLWDFQLEPEEKK